MAGVQSSGVIRGSALTPVCDLWHHARARDLGRLRDEFDRNLALLKGSGKYQKIIDAYMESLR